MRITPVEHIGNMPETDQPSPASQASPAVALSTHVEIEMVDSSGESERLAFDIVPEAKADFYAGYLGENTPLARAILGCHIGNRVVYRAGSETCKVTVLSVRASTSPEAGEGAEQRKAAVQQARQQIDRTNAMIFASTVEGKWGEYDTDSIPPEKE